MSVAANCTLQFVEGIEDPPGQPSGIRLARESNSWWQLSVLTVTGSSSQGRISVGETLSIGGQSRAHLPAKRSVTFRFRRVKRGYA